VALVGFRRELLQGIPGPFCLLAGRAFFFQPALQTTRHAVVGMAVVEHGKFLHGRDVGYARRANFKHVIAGHDSPAADGFE